MQAKSRDIWAATLIGLIVSGVLSSVLNVIGLPLMIGSLIGGIVAAFVLYGKWTHAAAAGALAGILSTPFFLGIVYVILVFELIPNPSGPTPPMSQLQEELLSVFALNLAAGAVGGGLTGALYHPAAKAEVLGTPATTPGQTRYCVQCGAQLPAGVVVCPHCNAKQP